MAVLSDSDRRAAWANWMRDNAALTGLSKSDLRAAVDALDDFLSANAATINAAIPQPARGALTAAQKARLLCFVVLQRWEKGV